MTYSTSGANDETFDVTLLPNGVPFLLGPATATPNPAYALSPVKLACRPTTPGPNGYTFSYQWFTDDGSGSTPPTYILIPGATATNVTVIPQDVYPGCSGCDYPTNYYFVATDTTTGNSVTSTVVAMTIHTASAPLLTDPTPASLITFAGGSVTYTAGEDGTLPITNQWQANYGSGYVPLTSRTNTTLVLNNVQTTDTGSYQLMATNLLGRTNTHSVTLTVLADPAAPNPATQIYANMANTNSPWAYWRLNETSNPAVATVTAYDYSGHGFLATYGNAMTVSNTGPVPPSLPGFDAGELAAGTVLATANSHLTVPALHLNGNSNVTFMAWINPNATPPPNAGLLFNRGGPDIACGFGFGNTAGHLGYTWNNNAAATYNWDSGLVPVSSQWNFVAYVITPTNATVYLGNLSGGLTNFLQNNNAIAHTAETFTGGTTLLGSDSGGASDVRNFNGLICEATLFTNALTTLQIQQYFLASIGATNLSPTVSSTIVSPGAATSPGVYSGQNVLLSANASGTEPIGLQWQSSSDGSTWANVPGATAPAVVLNPFAVGTVYYHLVATNTVSTTNAPVTVVFKALPATPAGLWTINFQITNDVLNYGIATATTGPGTGKYVGRGILGNGTYWNVLPDVVTTLWAGINVAGNTDLLDDGVTHSGIYCQVFNGSGFSFQTAPIASSSNITNLLGQWMTIYYAPNALQFHGVPDGTYNLMLMGMDGGWNDRGTTFVVHGSNGDQTNSTIDVSGVNVLSQGDNFVLFTGVHVSGGTLNVDVGPYDPAHGGGNTEADVNGAQLQLVSLDPPPTNVIVSGQYVSTNKTMTLSWPEGILQTTTNLLSPWTTIYAPSPVIVTATNGTVFYRIQVHP